MSRRKIFTAGDARDERARAEARDVARELEEARRDLKRRLARAGERYALYRGSIHRLARMRLAHALRVLGR